MLKRPLTAVLCLFLQSVPFVIQNGSAQAKNVPAAAASFDVASIRPSAPDSTGFSIRPNPNNFQVSGATLDYLVQYAYDVKGYQVKGGPG